MRQPRPAIVVLIVSIGVIVATGLLLVISQMQTTSQMTVESVGSRDLATLQADADPGSTGSVGVMGKYATSWFGSMLSATQMGKLQGHAVLTRTSPK